MPNSVGINKNGRFLFLPLHLIRLEDTGNYKFMHASGKESWESPVLMSGGYRTSTVAITSCCFIPSLFKNCSVGQIPVHQINEVLHHFSDAHLDL